MEEHYNSLDFSFAALMARLNRWQQLKRSAHHDSLTDNVIEIACRLLSYQVRMGHICLDLQQLPAIENWPATARQQKEQQAEEKKQERQLLTAPANHTLLCNASIVTAQPEKDIRPLVWQEGRLYLYRYYLYESEVSEEIEQRCCFFADSKQRIEQLQENWKNREDEAKDEVNDKGQQEVDRQKLAALLAFLRPFAIISGGPGRGKTTTVSKILQLYHRYRPNTRIALTASTGKGAARLAEALHAAQNRAQNAVQNRAQNRAQNSAQRDISQTAQEVQTIHRLLGKREGAAGYRYDRHDPLPVDLLMIDEASMLDLSLLAHILRALPQSAGLVLLGDHNQLASVEAGAVLGDLCRAAIVCREETVQKLQPLFNQQLNGLKNANASPLSESITILKKSYRFSEKSGIAALSNAIQQKDAKGALEILSESGAPDLENCLGQELPQSLHKSLLAGYLPAFEAKDALQSLQLLEQFRVLAPMRGGRYGTEELNRLSAKLLAASSGRLPRGTGAIDSGSDTGGDKRDFSFLYPLLIERNDYNLNLYNGDTGICFRNKEGKVLALFRSAKGELLQLPLALLPKFEICFAMTIHKSQGSEFDHLALVLPLERHPLLTGEMLYTAVTRAKNRLSLFGSEEVFCDAIQKRIIRRSGLFL